MKKALVYAVGIYAIAAVSIATASSASECKELCNIEWWKATATTEITAAIENADVHARDDYNATPLHRAAEFGTPENITALLSAGADIEAREQVGMTPLHMAAGFGTAENITTLLSAGAVGNLMDEFENTPFDYAKDNEKLKGTKAYWKLNDAQYK